MPKKATPRNVDDRAYRGLIEAVTDVAIYRLDRTGHVESWNPGAQRIKGYEADEIIGHHFSCFYTEEDQADGLPDRVLQTAADEGVCETEGWRVRRDGSRFWAHVVIDPIRDETGKISGFAKVTHDVTRNRRRVKQITDINSSLEQQVQARTALLRNMTVLQRAILADAAVAIIATNVQGVITLFNPAAQRMLGYTEVELLGKETPEVFHDPAEAAELGVLFTRARGGIADSREWSFVRKDGGQVPVLLNVTALRDEKAEIFGYLGMAVDLTERRERERLLAERTREAEAATRAKSRFLATMSHEIRSPMNAILGMLQMLMQSGLNADQTDYAAKAFSAAETLLRLLNDILDFSEIGADKLILEQGPFSLDTLMCDLQALAVAAAGDKKLALDFSIEPGLKDHVMGDMLRLRQTLLNLIGNAIKFTEQGSVKVSLRRPPAERRRSILQFTVEDTGIGIPPDKLATIFEGFQQADASATRQYGGTGLGLALSEKLITLMGGRLVVDSTVGVGSRFSFTLSLPPTDQGTALDTAPARATTRAAAVKPLAGLKLLLVDDAPLNQEVARHLLAAAGAEVIVADGGPSAIDLARAATPPFDLILMDLQMPGMDGLEATRLLRASPGLETVPVIAVTANATEADKAECRRAGMNDHIAKPFNIADLIPLILSHRPQTRPESKLVDVELALRRLADDRPLFAKVARQFAREAPPQIDQLDAAVKRAPSEGAAILHKFKSQAGMVGAQRLAGMAAGLEAELKAGGQEIDIPSLRALLEESSRELIELADAMVPDTRPEHSDVPLAEQLAELDTLLEAGNMRALEVCAAIEDSRRGIADDPFAAVCQAVDRLDFPAARTALKAMADSP